MNKVLCSWCDDTGVWWDSVAGQFMACNCPTGQEEEYFMNKAWGDPRDYGDIIEEEGDVTPDEELQRAQDEAPF